MDIFHCHDLSRNLNNHIRQMAWVIFLVRAQYINSWKWALPSNGMDAE